MTKNLRFTFHVLRSKYTLSLFLFTVAFIPRLLDLGRFLTADEFLWVDRSRNFVAGLTNAAYQCTTVVEQWEFAQGLACTLRTGHPGVTTMWTGSFGLLLTWLAGPRHISLHDYVVGVPTNPLEASLIAPERFGTVLLVSLWVVAVYWLARRLLGAQIALVGTLFIALDPFHIALSRVIHHDALSTIFMTLSALCAFIYWGAGKDTGQDKNGLEASAGVSESIPAKTSSPSKHVSNQRSSAGAGRSWLILRPKLADPLRAIGRLWVSQQKSGSLPNALCRRCWPVVHFPSLFLCSQTHYSRRFTLVYYRGSHRLHLLAGHVGDSLRSTRDRLLYRQQIRHGRTRQGKLLFGNSLFGSRPAILSR
jgi:hypothetical protein